jgi:hypothetical protein
MYQSQRHLRGTGLKTSISEALSEQVHGGAASEQVSVFGDKNLDILLLTIDRARSHYIQVSCYI